PTKITYLPTSNASHISVSGSLLCIGFPNSSFEIFDISNPRAPQRLGSATIPNTGGAFSGVVPVHVTISGRYVYVLFDAPNNETFQNFQIFDLIDPAHPQKTGSYRVKSFSD